jgi:hypothetical protein
MKKSAEVWQFVQRRSGSTETWVWLRLRADGPVEETSRPHENFGKAVADALAHGFQPRRDSWETRAGEWITKFAPGKAPISIRETMPPARRATGVRKTAARNPRLRKSLKSRRAKPKSPGGRPASAGKPSTRAPD